MENTRKTNLDFDAIAWAAFFILWGFTSLFASLPAGIGAIGIGLIMVGLNIARSLTGRPTSGFTTILGILALLLGGLELARPILNFSIDLPIFTILLLSLGAIMLGRELFKH